MESGIKTKIDETMAKFTKWGMLAGLTDNEVEGIRRDLVEIASDAISTAQRQTHQLLVNLYNKTYDIKK